ncbi:MAG: phosphate regulon sensor histidine kinase PhoR [Pseudomonadota bacterium]
MDLRKHMDDVRRRLSARRGLLTAGLVAVLLAVALDWLGWAWALPALAALGLWGALWPRDGLGEETLDEPSAVTRPRGETAAEPIWRQMLDAIPDPALMLDEGNHVLAANAGAAALLAVTAGRHIAHLHRSPELLGAVERARLEAVPQPFDVHVKVPIERHLSGMATPLRQGSRSTQGSLLLVVLRDRTEAEQLGEMRADFVANASHELRTPLASLRGFLETMQGAAKDDPEARQRFLAIMQQQAERMSRLIDDLLSLGRIEMREHVPPKGEVDLAGLVSEVSRNLAALAASADVRIELEQARGPLRVVGDRDELFQVVQNLMQNAIKYGRPGGRVRARLGRDNASVSLAVEDDGVGIDPVHLPRLTERFYRVNAKDSRERGGTGLGLAIVKHIVNRHQGQLRIESVPGRGSTFTVRLPAAHADQ